VSYRWNEDYEAATHPKYEEIHVKCACGNTFVTRSTNRGDIHVKSALPAIVLTGKQKVLDTAGRIERFRRKYAKKRQGGAAKTEQN